MENLHISWKEFKKGKTKKLDVKKFAENTEDNLVAIHQELQNQTYQHSKYSPFYIKDPKLRHIHKACVKDRIIHHAIFRIVYPIFDKSFIFDSYSCRDEKGTHRAVKRLKEFARKVSKNNSRTCFILKCDIKKFFNSIDHTILLDLLKKKIDDQRTFLLIEQVIRSFAKGIPLGNITSQIFANIYLNELDQFVKHGLKLKYYIRYCDDFVVVSENGDYLKNLIPKINDFLSKELKLSLHPKKITINRYHKGIDFLGYILFPRYSILRTKTRQRVFRKIRYRILDLERKTIARTKLDQTIQSYLGVLKHCDSYKLKAEIAKMCIKLS